MQLVKPNKLQILIMLFCVLALLVSYIFIKNSPQAIDLGQYNKLLNESLIKEAKIYADEVILYTNTGVYSIAKEGINIGDLLSVTPISVKKKSNIFELILTFVLFVSALCALYYYQKIQNKNVQKRDFANLNAAVETEGAGTLMILPSVSKVKFSDVAGIKGVKEELVEIVDFLKNPSVYQKMSVKLPRGVLLVGPPGVGKTMIAKAVAGEASVPFFYQSGAGFVHIYVGMGAKRVRELFSTAKSNAPSIVFIDEIDAVGKARGGMRNDEREATLNQLLTEMDGFEDNSGVIVIAATNRLEMIDEALLRSGRFDRRIFVSLPDLHDREKIIGAYLFDKTHNVNISDIAKMSVGFSGAALSTLVNEAAINALRRGSKRVETDDFLAVRDKVLLGKKRLARYSDKEKNIQAVYQAAKALCAYWFEINFDKIGLVGDFTKEIDKEIESRTELVAKIKVALAGIAALKIYFNETYSNSSDDLNKARRLATEMVEKYAMGERMLPTAQDIENILLTAMSEAELFLEGMKKPLDLLIAVLLEEENLTKEKIKDILGEVF
ncbi:MAG: ATP-dependent metallopeptidase FtsH/Yme1/Tma family protein [Campylobacteraceae bacterium]|jgi:ATP-dependent metalloprotease FtsH|nr:ATP-dependent metallopeptidase FtsH/Yme1/Tma family protein [Campylobacteraceae bacterium]